MKVLSAVAWPYANGPRHLGHVAGFGVPSDVFSRYMRMAGHDVLMVSGSDEHGTPDPRAGRPGRGHPARVRRHQPRGHRERAHRPRLLLRPLHPHDDRQPLRRGPGAVHPGLANGYMVEQTTQGAISPSTGRTLPDRYIEGTCPICGYGEARGDQCDNCGNQLDPTDLIDPRSRINGETPEFVETQHFLLDLPALADALRAWLEERAASGTWRPNVIKFSLNILDDIRPRAMTRDIDWGIPVPLDGWRDNPTKRLYVWFDAVVGYLSASVEWARRTGDPERWREWWNDPEAVSHYFMGKDNITFHSQIWPAELLGVRRQGQPRRRAGGLRRAEPAHRGRLERVPHDGGQAVLHLARLHDPRARRPRALRARRHPLLHLRGRAREPGRQLHLARLRAAQQLRARRRLGQPRLPHGGDGGRRTSARSRSRARSSRSTRRCAPRCSPGSTPSAACSSGTARRPRSPRRCASSARSTPTSRAPSRSSSRATTSASGSPRCCTPWCSACPTSTRCSRRSCRTRPTGSTRCSVATARSCPCRAWRRSPGSTTATRAAPTPSSPATTRPPRGGSRARSSSARRSASRRRCSPSSTSRWSTRSSPGRRAA